MFFFFDERDHIPIKIEESLSYLQVILILFFGLCKTCQRNSLHVAALGQQLSPYGRESARHLLAAKQSVESTLRNQKRKKLGGRDRLANFAEAVRVLAHRVVKLRNFRSERLQTVGKLLQRCRRLRKSSRIDTNVRKHREQIEDELLGRRYLDLDQLLAVVVEAGETRGAGNCFIQPAEFIDQAVGQGFFPAPDLALTDTIDVIDVEIAPPGNAIDKIAVAIVDHDLEQLPGLVAHFSIRPQLARPGRRTHAVSANAYGRQRALERREHAHDSN